MVVNVFQYIGFILSTYEHQKKFFYRIRFPRIPPTVVSISFYPSGLSEWFADNVNSRGEQFTFIWDDSEETALLLQKKNNDKVKFQWQNDEEDDEDYYFEFKIQVDEITKDVSLIVTDFAEEDELEESKMLWDNLVSDLKQVLGAS